MGPTASHSLELSSTLYVGRRAGTGYSVAGIGSTVAGTPAHALPATRSQPRYLPSVQLAGANNSGL